MRTQLTITQATDEDIPALLAIQKNAFQAEAKIYDDYSLPPLVEAVDEMTAAGKTGIILKAGLNGVPVGSVRAKQNGNICEIGRLSVTPNYQRQGIGRALLKACETVFPETHACELFTGNQSLANIKLYESLGYRRAKGPVPSANRCGGNVTLIHFQKHISKTITATAAQAAAQAAPAPNG
ncbi:MAG: GNAT family N-acetyltransferase [Opitutaceae bacterium]|nr:GNAT family N-acetyltransferase [Opitutaceae bacterium]